MIDAQLAQALMDRFGSPLYAYDLDVLDRRADELRETLPADASLFYSLKANPLPALCRALGARGVRAEVSSAGELAVALHAGADPARMLYTGPGKTRDELAGALAAGVECFSCESETDYRLIADAARRAGRRARVLLRVNPPSGAGYGLTMSGVASQFGFERDGLRRVMDCGADGSAPAVRGIHVYYGTQVRDVEMLAAQAARILALADEVFAGTDGPAVVGMGGGFPWPFGTVEGEPELGGLRPALRAVFAGRAAGPEHWFESGRYLAASSGSLLATVLDVKESRGRRFVVLDAGINHLGGFAGLGRIHLSPLSLVPLDGAGRGDPAPATVVGPLCTPLDVLTRGDAVPDLRPGDRVAVPNVGAYAATASLTGFLSRPPATEVVHRGGDVLGEYRLRHGHEQLS
jgi:diaminopimelate decarboxylase